MLCFTDDVPAYPDVSRVSIHVNKLWLVVAAFPLGEELPWNVLKDKDQYEDMIPDETWHFQKKWIRVLGDVIA